MLNFISKPVKAFFVGLIAGCVLSAGVYIGGRLWPPRPTGLDEFEVLVNPTEDELPKVQYVIVEKLDGHSQAHVTLLPDPEPVTPISEEEPVDDEPHKPPDPSWTFRPGDEIRYPWEGNIKVNLVDERTGRELSKGVTPIQGQTTLTWDDTGFEVDTRFTGVATIGFTPPKQNPKRLEIGTLAGVTTKGDGFVGPYARYDVKEFSSRLVDGAWWVGGAYLWTTNGAEGIIITGLNLSF